MPVHLRVRLHACLRVPARLRLGTCTRRARAHAPARAPVRVLARVRARVHCPGTCIAYLMMKEKLPLEAAFRRVFQAHDPYPHSRDEFWKGRRVFRRQGTTSGPTWVSGGNSVSWMYLCEGCSAADRLLVGFAKGFDMFWPSLQTTTT